MKRLITWIALAMPMHLLAEDEVYPGPEDGFTQMLVMLAIIGCAFYFLMWRPEQKKRKEIEDQRNALSKGDKVTAMGIIGTVHRVEQDTVILRMVDGAKLEFLKGAISEVLESGNAEKKGSEKIEALAVKD